MRYRYIYKYKTGLTKVKTRLAIAITAMGLGAGGVFGAVAIFGAAHAAPSYSLFGSASQQSDGVHITSDSGANPYGGISLAIPAGTTVSNISELNADFSVLSGSCGVGSPRYSIELSSTESIFVYLGDSPNYATCSGGPTGNLLSGFVDTSQIPGGTFYDTWARAQTLVGSSTVQGLDLVVDGGWSATQSFLFTSLSLNGSVISTVPVPTKDSCKNNGWKTMTDGTNSFKNQGDCVSFFATNGKNTAAVPKH